MSLHKREAGLIHLIRRLKNGTLTTLAVKDGLPNAVSLTEQRIEFSNEEHLGRLFELEGTLAPLGTT